MTSAQIWVQAKEILKQSIAADHLHLFADLQPEPLSAEGLVLTTKNHANYLGVVGFYGSTLHEAIRAVAPTTRYQVRYVGDGDGGGSGGQGGENNSDPAPPTQAAIPARFRFETFIQGSCNELAVQAIHRNIAPLKDGPAAPALSNPLVLYGHCGVGKTHLLYAIANQIAEWRPGASVLYRTAHTFFQDMRKALVEKDIPGFRQRYQAAEVLLLDDLHFLVGKQRTQEELSYICSDLIDNGNGLLVLTSKCCIADLKLENVGLKTRLQGGLTSRIQLPCLETRRSILHNRSKALDLSMPEECLQLVAEQAKDARRLEGVLAQVQNHVLQRHPDSPKVSVELVREALREQGVFSRMPSPEDVLRAVSKHYNISKENILSGGRAKQVVKPRQIAMYLLRELTDSSYPEIGKQIGNRDHSTVMHACKKISKLQETNAPLRAEVEQLRDDLTST